MRKITLSMHVSLDGFVAGPAGEMDWIKVDATMFDLVEHLTDAANTALYGRVTYEMMNSYWPTAGQVPGASHHDKTHSNWYNKVNKLVASHRMKDRPDDKTFILDGDIARQVKEMKEETGGNILIFGSPSVVHLLVAENLIDDYWLFINPVILNEGIPLFRNGKQKIDLRLEKNETFTCGVTAVNYTVIR